MQDRNYRSILLFIVATILVTLLIQGYWNYKNYQVAKQQFINEVQIGLDNAVNTYYAELAQDNILGVSLSEEARHMELKSLDSIFFDLESSHVPKVLSSDTILVQPTNPSKLNSISIFTGAEHSKQDTLLRKLKISTEVRKDLYEWSTKKDTLLRNPLESLTTKVIFAITQDSLRLPELDTLVGAELARKNIPASFSLRYQDEKGHIHQTTDSDISENAFTTKATSSYLPKRSILTLAFNNATSVILKRNIIGFLLSLLVVISVIGCLLYLLRIINRQKQLAEVKNDLISNITHEFKTPLATIAAAVEGIQTFNETNDPEKNKRYAKISETQVSKLTGMVEKLLETATLDSDKLPLDLETTNLNELISRICQKEHWETTDKTLTCELPHTPIVHPIDVFHFENALNNVIDNAIKYGGDFIRIAMIRNAKHIEITITDSGSSLTTAQQQQLFEKFYRVPKGNTHDIKGFGIGLYYTRKIVEKHQGTITVSNK
ncbi:MAG: HAMP domain-containing sensor histidine kinase, partial [Marinirhabdus sp.]|nr:HAMP domain-containing sensor histidine kinase [Marinirhabdus sp.]